MALSRHGNVLQELAPTIPDPALGASILPRAPIARVYWFDVSRHWTREKDLDLYDPAPDFAMLARSMGWHGSGPIEEAEDLAEALRQAVVQVKRGRPALVDVITQKR